jgi:uncharacterized surface protein with fasciclin (FAS1) repeats
MTRSATRRAISLALAAALAAGGCSEQEQGAPAAKTAGEANLTKALTDANGTTAVAGALAETGLGGIFDGKASYTLLAPTDAALQALGAQGTSLRAPENRAAFAALLREHIVPGYLTPKDIGTAVSQASDGKVTMRSMGTGSLTFSRSGEAITVTGPDGAVARLSGKPISAGSSIALPVDGLLKNVVVPPGPTETPEE